MQLWWQDIQIRRTGQAFLSSSKIFSDSHIYPSLTILSCLSSHDSYASIRDHARSSLVGHRLWRTQNEQDTTLMDATESGDHQGRWDVLGLLAGHQLRSRHYIYCDQSHDPFSKGPCNCEGKIKNSAWVKSNCLFSLVIKCESRLFSSLAIRVSSGLKIGFGHAHRQLRLSWASVNIFFIGWASQYLA